MIILLYLYPLMGLIHLVGAFIRFCFGKDKYPDYKKKLASYLLIVGIYFLLMIAATNIPFIYSHISNTIGTIYIGIIPWFIAGYYWTIIYGPTEKKPSTNIISPTKNN